MPLVRRIPKRGFNNRWAVQVAIINVGDLEGCMFRNRCDSVHAACETGYVDLKELSEGRGYRCRMSVEECITAGTGNLLTTGV